MNTTTEVLTETNLDDQNSRENEQRISTTRAVSRGRSTNSDQVVLRLKVQKKPAVRWSEETVDNENMGKKTSKRCCIYHKARKFGESDSDESDSDVEEARKQSVIARKKKIENYQRFHA